MSKSSVDDMKMELETIILDNKFSLSRACYVIMNDLHKSDKRIGGEPGIVHQLSVTMTAYHLMFFLRDRNNKNDLDLILGTALLHDTIEDHKEEFLQHKSSLTLSSSCKLMKNIFILSKTETKNLDDYFNKCSENEFCSLVKGCDRLHNLTSMVYTFPIKKQFEYISETMLYVIPMLEHSIQLHQTKYQENQFMTGALIFLRDELKARCYLIFNLLKETESRLKLMEEKNNES